jgi:prepilin-type N-terminal cleavage/methylation domain-containing protein
MIGCHLPSARRRLRRARPARSECGLTLVEVLIASVVMSVIVASVAGVMLDMQQVGNRAMSGENASDTARAGLLEFQRDLEAANPLVDWTSTSTCSSVPCPVSDFADVVQLELGPTGGTQKTITWSCVSGTLWRDMGTATGTGVPEVTGVTNCSSSTNPVFSYYGEQGEDLGANNWSSATSAVVTACSIRVQALVDVSAGADTTPFTEQVSVRLANWEQGALPCP